MEIAASAIVCAVRAHGETGVIATLLTRDHGLRAGYVRGGRSRALRPLLQPGGTVQATLRARVDEQLPALTVTAQRPTPVLAAPRPVATALLHATALTAAALVEADPHPRLHDALASLLDQAAGSNPLATLTDVARFERLLLDELGVGLDLTRCAVTGVDSDLAWVSPKSGMAVSATAGAPWAGRLLPYPTLLTHAAEPTPDTVRDALRVTGLFLARQLDGPRYAALWEARARLVDAIS